MGNLGSSSPPPSSPRAGEMDLGAPLSSPEISPIPLIPKISLEAKEILHLRDVIWVAHRAFEDNELLDCFETLDAEFKRTGMDHEDFFSQENYDNACPE